MDNLQHWYVPNDRKAITSERMVSEIVMMNKLKIRAELKYLKSGAMCWMVYLPADDICKDVWCIALIYNKDFSMPGCKEPFVAMMAKPKPEELTAAIEKCGKMESDLVISVNPEGKSDMTCVEAVENLIEWRKTIYPLLDFTPNEELVQKEAPVREPVKVAIDNNPVHPEVRNFVHEEQQEVGTEDELFDPKQGLINQNGSDNIVAVSGSQSMNVNSIVSDFVARDDMLIMESPDGAGIKKHSMVSDDSNDEDDGEIVALDYLDESGNFVADVPSFE